MARWEQSDTLEGDPLSGRHAFDDGSQDRPDDSSPNQGQPASRVSPWLRWVVLGPVLFAVLYACSLLGLVSAPHITYADTRSGLMADYSPWPFTVIRPVRPELALEVLSDQARYPGIYATSAGVVPSWTPTTTPSSPSPTASISATATPTLAGSASPSATPTHPTPVSVTVSPTPIRTPTQSSTPSPTYSATHTPTRTPTRTPTQASPPPMSWFNPAWRFRKRITVRALRVAGSLTDFPALINLGSDPDLAADAQNDGDDVLFTAANGTSKLSHEVETFDGGSGRLVAWVKIPNLSSSADTVLFMYYGNASASSQQDQAGVWDSGFRGVWHMADVLTGQPVMVEDSTGFGNHGVAMEGMGPQNQVGGQVDGSLTFDGVDDVVEVPNRSSLQVEGDLTLEAWVRRLEASYGVILMKDWGSELNYSLVASSTTGARLDFYYDRSEEGAAEQRYSSADPVLGVGSWEHIAATFTFGSGGSCRLYVNGASVSGSWISGDGSLPAEISNLATLRFGSAQSNPLQAGLDEIRISSVIRPPAWIATEYNNQSSPSTFYVVGPEEAHP